jgi:Carbohydrate-selective porin, OprB family
VGSELNDNYENFNPEHQSAGTGSISRFGRFSSIYRLNNEGASFGLDQKLSPNLGLVLSYGVPRVATPGVGGTAPETVNSPTQGNGLFNGSNTLFSQLTLKPSDNLKLGLAYARTYNSTGTGVSGSNGTNFANNPFNSAAGAGNRPTTADHYSLLASTNLSPNLILSGWGGYTQARRQDAAGSADIWEYALTLAAKDFGGKGNTLGFVAGMQPKLTSNSGDTAARVDAVSGLNFEAFYKYKVSDNLSITPGLLLLTNPENKSGPAEYLGTIRTTFTF